VFTADSKFLAVLTRTRDDVTKVTFCDVATGAAAHVLDVSDEKSEGSRRLSKTHLWDIVAGAEGAQIRFVRSNGLETWDASTGAQVGSADADVDGTEYAVTSDRKVTALRTHKGIVVADAATKAERFRLADPEPTGEKPKKGTMVLSTTRNIVGFTTDGALLLVRIEREVLKDPNALGNENLSPEKRLAAIKKSWWIEAVKTADGKTAWKADVDERTYADDVVPGAALVAVIEKDALKWRDAGTGGLKGQFVCGKKLSTAAVSADGRTFWAGTDDGFVLPAK
jgi:hypothetical protein